MGIFLITPLSQNADALSVAIKNKLDEANRYEMQNKSGYLVVFPGTTVELSNHVGITGQEAGEKSLTGSALVTPLTSYYGRGPTDMWEWLRTRFEKQ